MPFVAGEVQLLDGPFKVSLDANARNLLSLDVDRLLAPFVTASGGAPKAPPYLGWETRLLPGVALSFYLSGAARVYRMTGDGELGRRLDYALCELEECQKRDDEGYLLGTVGGRHILARVEREGFFTDFGYWGRGEATPYYALEKLMSGLRDVYRICHDPRALGISVGIGDWLERHMARLSDHVLQQLMRIEYGGMNWVLADLYADTGEERFLALSRRWHDTVTVVPMSRGEDVLTGVHANWQFPKYSGLAARYPYSGDSGDLKGARFFWESMVFHRTYVTGGNSESEYLGPRGELRHRLTPHTEENCNEYNMLRLTALLAQIEPKVEYADYCERTLFNHLLGAQNPQDGKLCYFTPLMPGAAKVYQPLDFFSCCTASGMDSYARPAEYIYSRVGDAIQVNQFIASELRDVDRGVMLRQETQFPYGDTTTLTIRSERETDLDLYLRNPYWAEGQVVVSVNGRQVPDMPVANGYFLLRRRWSDGDTVSMTLPMRLRMESMPDDPDMIALLVGPVLLAADLDEADADALALTNAAPALVPGGVPLSQWLEQTESPRHYRTTIARPHPMRVIPFFEKKTGPYAVYWQRMCEEQWAGRVALEQRRVQEEWERDAATIDGVSAADEMSEARHRLSGTSSTGWGNNGILGSMPWRTSLTDAFGYDLAVDGSRANTLFCRFMGRESYEEWACRITIDGTPIKVLDRRKDDSYPTYPWSADYPIPLELTQGKATVRIEFEPLRRGRMKMPRLIEMRTLRTR